MGLGDLGKKIGDAWDVVKDAGVSAVGAALDIARADDSGIGPGDVGYDPKARSTVQEIAHHYSQLEREHRTATAPFRGAVAPAAGTLAAGLQYGVDKADRAASTWEILNSQEVAGPATGLGVSQLFDADKWGQAWRLSDNVTAGQGLFKRSGETPLGQKVDLAGKLGIEDSTWANIHRYGTKDDAKYSTAFSLASGSFDAVFKWGADPLVIAGKGAKIANAAKEELRAGDLVGSEIKAGLRPGGLASKDLTRRQKQVTSELDSLVDGTVGKPMHELMQYKAIRESNQGAAMASLLSQADTPEQGRLIWLTAQGSTRAKEALVAQRADLGFKLDRMQSQLDDLAAPKPRQPGGLNIPQANDDKIAVVNEEIKRDKHVADLLDRAIGDKNAIASAAERDTLLAKDSVGIFGSANGRRVRTSRLDQIRANRESSYVIQNGIGGVPIRVGRAPFTRRPHGWFDNHDAEGFVQEVDRMSKQLRGLDPNKRMAWIDRAVRATDDNARALEFQRIENEMIDHLGSEYGYDKGDVQKLIEKMRAEQGKHIRGFKERNYGITEDGTVHTTPISETQLANMTPTVDLTKVRQVLKREAAAYKAAKLGHGAYDVIEHGLDQFNDLWKFQVLLRGGYVARNVIDGQIRLLSVLGAREAMRQHAETFGYRTGKPLSGDAQAAIETRIARLRDQLAAREEGSVRLYRGSHEPLDPSRIGDEGARFTTQRDYAEQYGGDKFLYQIDVPKSKMQQTLFSDSLGTGPLPHTMLDRATAQRARLVRAPKGHAAEVHPENGPVFVDDAGTAGLRDEIAALEAQLTADPRLKPTKVGGYDVAHPYGGSPDMAGVVRGRIDSNEEWASYAADYAEKIQNELRGSGDWVTRKGDDPLWVDSWLRVVNRHLRQGEISSRLMQGESPADVVRWLKSSQEGGGRSVWRRLGHGHDSPEDLVQANLETLNHTIPDEELRKVLADRAATEDDVKALWGDSTSARPEINSEQLAFAIGQGPVLDFLNRMKERYFKFANAMPDDVLARHPMYRALYRGQMRRELHRLDPKLEGVITADEQRVLEEQARMFARREMKRMMFDASNKSNLGHFLRFTSPFYTAWEDVIRKYSRIVFQNPTLIPHWWQVWTAPNDTTLFETVDATTGKPVSAKDSRLGSSEMIVLPQSWTKKLGLNVQPRISKGGFNVVLQGDKPYIPGAGPMVQAAVQDVVVALDSPKGADVAKELGILSYGVQDKGLGGWRYFLSSALNQTQLSDAQKGRLFAMVLQTEEYRWRNGDRKTEPTAGEIKSRVRKLTALRTFTSLVSPSSVQYTSPYQLYIDEYHAMLEDPKIGPLKADEAFYNKHGEDLYLFTMSMSQDNTGIRPSVRADKAAQKYSDLIAKHPEYGWFYVGPDNVGDYNRSVYNLQTMRPVSPTSTKKFRDTYQDPFEALKKNQAEIGWIEYTKMRDKVDEAVRQGADPQQVADIKKQWLEAVTAKDGPDWGKAWYDDYQDRDEGKVRKFLEAARDATKDPRLAKRSDIRTMAMYLQARDKVRAVLAARAAAGMPSTLTAKANADVASVWAQIGQALLEQNVTFGDIYHRYLEQDTLEDAA